MDADLKASVETLLFITDQPLSLGRLGSILGEKDAAALEEAVRGLQGEYAEKPLQIVEVAGGFQMATRPAYASFVRKLYADKMTMRLSAAAMETLSIIAYKQPLTRAEIEEIRGVEVIAALETLLEKNLVQVAGRKETVGRPLLYGTTQDFLRHFGLRGLADLPPIDSFTPPQEESAPSGEGAAAAAAPAGEAAPEPQTRAEASSAEPGPAPEPQGVDS